MTLNKLKELYYLNRSIPRELQRIAEMEATASTPSAVKYTGMPKSSSGYYQSKLENNVMKIQERRERLERMIAKRDSLQQFIDDTPDSFTRYLLTLRFVDNMSWKEIAYTLGGRNTEESVKKRCYRYLKGCEDDEQNEGTPAEV
ncbi:MAG: hypothetical protein ACI4R6_03875 [Lachnospiraceae bacterium]